jgi:DNA-binding transcriptional regulator YbjK
MADSAGRASRSETATSHRRYDPNRRDRIIEVCLDVIAEVGVAGVSHRRVAEAADVPLGSMTYHFTGMDELLREAFDRFARTVSDRFEQRMSEADNPAAAERAVVTLINEDVYGSARDLVLSYELYTLAAREPAFRDITNAWMSRSRAALEQHFDPLTALLLDALIEGLTIHRALDTDPQDAEVVVQAVRRVTVSGSGRTDSSKVRRR